MKTRSQSVTAYKAIEVEVHKIMSDIKSPKDFPLLHTKLENLKTLCDQEHIKFQDIHNYFRQLKPDFVDNTLIGHCLTQPYGYAGDFEIIDKFYTNHTSDNQEYRVWDQYIQSIHSVKAVRNRKVFFKELVKSLFTNQEEFKILNIASGPARDLCEVYEQTPNSDKIKTTCVDMDPFAIQFGRDVTHKYAAKINFVQKNIFKFLTEEKYDLIWSAGLFDYFSDEIFIKLLRRFKSWGKPGSYIVIGNFNENYNPSRTTMELLGDWSLTHRTEAQLTDIAIKAGFNRAAISVGREEQNVNLFLMIRL